MKYTFCENNNSKEILVPQRCKKEPYVVGIDIGTNSCAVAAVRINEKGELDKMLHATVKEFPSGANPKNGSSLIEPKRIYREDRRRNRRRKERKRMIKSLIIKYGLPKDIDMLSNPYEIRTRALYELLSADDFSRILIQLSQRRGYKSNRRENDNGDIENKKVLTSIKENQDLMKEKGYITIGEMLYKDEKFANCKRNKEGEHIASFLRDNYIQEIKTIFSKQREFGNQYATSELEEAYLKIYTSQREFDEGPGENSPYAGNQIENKLGKCTFEKDKTRAVKATYSFEYFNLLQKINSIRIISNKTVRTLTKEERNKIKLLALSKNSITYKSLRKELKLTESEYFNLSYSEGSIEEVEKKTKFSYLPYYHAFKKVYPEYDSWEIEKRDTLAYGITIFKSDKKLREYLSEKGFSEDEIELAFSLPNATKTCHLSLEALRKITPFLEEGDIYNVACEKAGYDFQAKYEDKRTLIPTDTEEIKEITNPVVKKSILEAIEMINAFVIAFGSPTLVRIELAREMGKTPAQKKKIELNQKKNAKRNEEIKELIKKDFSIPSPSMKDVLCYMLYQEQDGVSIYSGEKIEYNRLYEPEYVEIDHIIPHSLSFDNSYDNKVLVLRKENRDKGNSIPMEYIPGNKKENFSERVRNSKLSFSKKQKLLKEKLTEEDISGFGARRLNDTRYISTFLINYLKKYLFLESNNLGIKETITAVNGHLTARIRRDWGIEKNRANGALHHAVDAIVVAFTDTRLKSQIVKSYGGNKKIDLPYPWFLEELNMRLSKEPTKILSQSLLPNYSSNENILPIIPVRKPVRKKTGQAHEETIMSMIEIDGVKYAVKKVPLTALKLNKDNEIIDYYNKESDLILYNALREKLISYNGDAKKAFEEPFYKPKSDGSQGPLVKRVKTIKKITLPVLLPNGGIAKNGEMLRVDVFFSKENGYSAVPVYVTDVVKDKLPNKAITINKPYSKWKTVTDNDFKLSLYRNSLIRIKSEKPINFKLVNKDSSLPESFSTNEVFVYYKGIDISSAAISVITPDNAYEARVSIKGLLLIKKYKIDAIGRINEFYREKREKI